MTVFETAFPFLTGALAIFAAVLLFLTFRTERRLSDRRHITLQNYREKNGLFYIGRDIPVTVLSGLLAVLTLALLIAGAVDAVVRVYLIPLGAVLLLAGVLFLLAFTRGKYGRDIHVFDEYYVRVQDLLSGKERTLRDLGVCRRRAGDLKSKLSTTLAAFNRNLQNGIPAGMIENRFAPVEDMIRDYEREIADFSEKIEAQFNASLSAFLLENAAPTLTIIPLRTFDEGAVDDLLESIKTSFGSDVAERVIAEVERGAVNSAAALGNIMDLLHTMQVSVEGETLLRFISAAAGFEDREALVALLYHNRQVPAALVTGVFLTPEYAWTYIPGMREAFNRRELAAILSELAEKDEAERTVTFLSGFGAEDGDILTETLAGVKAENGATRAIRAKALMLSSRVSFGNIGSIFEELALALSENGAECGVPEDEREKIGEIAANGQIWERRREIAACYEDAAKRGTALIRSAERMVVLYLCYMNDGLLDGGRLAALCGEAGVTLRFSELSVLRLLLAARMLLSGDAAVARAVRAELLCLRSPLDISGMEDGEAGRKILSLLVAKEPVRLRAVLYRTENERKTLDKITAEAGGNYGKD